MSQKNQHSVLVVDDEADLRELLVITLGRMNLDAKTAINVADAKKKLAEHSFSLCLTDMNLPDGSGLELVEHINQQYSRLPVAVITAYGSMETATRAMKAGAFDFIAKPVTLKQVKQLIENGLNISDKPEETATPEGLDLIGKSASMEALRLQIKKLARSQAPVYISGESGSGKEKVARLIHAQGARHNQPFVAINCGAIPSELMESEFFGHKKGSFTGAYEDRKGLFREADGGTLFLDEVADLPLQMQVKLLRAIQEKTVRPVGDNQEYAINVRFLCATHKNLADEVAAERFRQDLYYRLNVIEAAVPPLRDRPEDVELLTHFILKRLCKEWQIEVPILDSNVLTTLKSYAFPGNVRELENILERALTLADTDVIQVEHLQINNQPSSLQVKAQGRDLDQSLEDYLENIEKKSYLKH